MAPFAAGSVAIRRMRLSAIDRDQPVVAPIPDRGHDPALITPQEQADETMATQEIKDLLLEAGPFARLGATEQRTRLVTYYQSWFLSDYRIDTVNNIRATQRLTTHAKLMAMPVGVILQAILEEASGRSPAPTVELSLRGLLDVEPSPGRPGDNPVGPAVHHDEDQVDTVDLIEAVPAEAVPAEAVPAEAPPAGDVPGPCSPVPAPGRGKSRSNRVK
jgi:hypothetical protein